MILALMMHSEGDDLFSKNLSVGPFLLLQADGEKSGDTGHRDAQLRWPPPGIPCEPIKPAPAVMRTHRTRRARGRGNALRQVRERKHLDILPTPVGHPGAAKRSPRHIHPPHRSKQDWLALHNRGRRGQETTDRADSTGPISFGP